MQKSVVNMREVFAVVKPNSSVDTLEVTPSLYESLNNDYSGFENHHLLSCHDFISDWGTWEMHPAGDEAVLLLSGNAKMVLRIKGVDETVVFNTPGEYIVIPKGIWHTALVSEAATMVFFTPGAGTKNADNPE